MRSCADTSLSPTFTCLSTFPGCAGHQHQARLAAGVWAVDTVRTTAVKPGWGPGQETPLPESKSSLFTWVGGHGVTELRPSESRESDWEIQKL